MNKDLQRERQFLSDVVSQKMLIVDDRQSNLFAMEKLFKDFGPDIILAESGKEALSLVLRHEFALILLDVQMPELDGFETASLIRSYDATKHVPIIFLTAINKEEKHVFKGYEKGAVDYLFKPVDPAILKGKIRVFLELDRQKQELRHAKKKAETALAEAKKLSFQNQLLLNFAGEGILGLTHEGDISFANPAAVKMLEMEEEELIGLPFGNLLNQENKATWNESSIYYTLQEGKCHHEADGMFLLPEGRILLVEYTCSAICEKDNTVSGGVVMFKDIAERKKIERTLKRLAREDHLTGLANRAVFNDFLDGAMIRAKRQGHLVAVFFLDLDRFKYINDTMGHHTGDYLLKKVAARLKKCVRECDLVARLGGDEFALVFENIEKPEYAVMVARKILDTLSPAHRINGNELFATSSIGIAIYPESGTRAECLCKAADTAMYHAKQQGRNNFMFFHPEMQKVAEERMQLERELRKAMKKNELTLFYQPQINAANNSIVGMEALLRWQHQELGYITPAQFVPLAEDTGLINPLGEWVLQTACIMNKSWKLFDNSISDIKVAVNVSARQLQDKNFWGMIQKNLGETGLDPRSLEIELTESTIMENPEEAQNVLKKVNKMGVSIAIDDFGTGYSSLSYLRNLPIDSVKIDRSFVGHIGTDSNNESIVKAIIALGNSLGLQVIAEGVETADQLSFLLNNNCNLMQGYYFHPPLSPEQTRNFMLKN